MFDIFEAKFIVVQNAPYDTNMSISCFFMDPNISSSLKVSITSFRNQTISFQLNARSISKNFLFRSSLIKRKRKGEGILLVPLDQIWLIEGRMMHLTVICQFICAICRSTIVGALSRGRRNSQICAWLQPVPFSLKY